MTTPPPIAGDADLVRSFLSDAAHVPGGSATGVAFPASADEVSALVAAATRVLPVGAQSSLTGGATPRGDLVLSTRAMTQLSVSSHDQVRVAAGVPLSALQRELATRGLYYPPVPTFDGAFMGGTIATNAAGAATFKHGSTRNWVAALTVVLAGGDLLEVERGEVTASPEGSFEIEHPSGDVSVVAVPDYHMPDVPKLSAGYFARPGMDLIDLFIGSEGTLGVIVEARVRVVRHPELCLVLIECADETQSLSLTKALREEARKAWRGESALDVAAVEYMDARAVALVPSDAFVRAHVPRPAPLASYLLVQLELPTNDQEAFSRFETILENCDVRTDPRVAMPGDAAGAARLFELREAVPASVNATVGATQARVHPDIQKTAGDMIVPFERLADSLAVFRREFDLRKLDYAIWGHASDGNLHPNVLPRSLEDVERGREAILAIGRAVIAMGGSPLAEHGVGRSTLKQLLLRELYGEHGVEQMRAVKRVLDPKGKLAPGVLF